MASAHNLMTRERIVTLYNQGLSMRQISLTEHVNYSSVKTLIQRYKTEGEHGLIPRYGACGKRRTPSSEVSYRLVRWYKHFHPLWGVAYILMKIQDLYPDLPLCVSRVYERRLKSVHRVTLSKNPPLQCDYHPQRARLPHDIWQVDAKENLVTLDGQAACYLTITDEKTGSVLVAKVFSLWPYQPSAFGRHAFGTLGDIQAMGAAVCY